MSSFELVTAAAGYVLDAVTEEYVIGDAEFAYEHGGWEWCQRDIYRLDKYNLELGPELIIMALS